MAAGTSPPPVQTLTSFVKEPSSTRDWMVMLRTLGKYGTRSVIWSR